MIVEFVGGFISNSTAIKTDATHLLSDFFGFLFSLISVYLSRKKSTEKHSYGYVRAEILGALLSVFIIWGMTVYIMYEAVDKIVRIVNKEDVVIEVNYMLITALIGLLVNVIMGLTLHDKIKPLFGHGHDCHGHSHGERSCHGDGHSHRHSHFGDEEKNSHGNEK